jgi:hypothetical protein
LAGEWGSRRAVIASGAKQSSDRDACRLTLMSAFAQFVSVANSIGNRLDLWIASLRSQ